MIITKRENIRYITGFNGSFGFVIGHQEKSKFVPTILATDARYIEQAKQCTKGSQINVILWNNQGQKTLKKQLQNEKEIYVEDSMSLAELNRWKKSLPGAKFIPQTNIIEEIRAIKTEEEIKKIKIAATHVDSILSDTKLMKTILFENVTEKEAAFLLEQLIQDKGRFGIAFPSIIAFGENSSIPHHEPGLRKLKRGDNILIDCGSVFEGFHSDITRNYSLGEVSEDFRKSFSLLKLAQEATIEQYQPGLNISEIDQSCRDLLGNEKEFFTHSLGHGVGLEIHELPQVRSYKARTPKSQETRSLNFELGQVVTCEPGLYYPGKFGIRIEDLLVITKNGPKVLTNTPKELVDLS